MVNRLLDKIDKLKQENAQLKKTLKYAYEYKKKYYEIKHYKRLSEKLKEALHKCRPHTRRGLCEFCLESNFEHSKDCEYLKLTESEG